jgi:hypothetical protein
MTRICNNKAQLAGAGISLAAATIAIVLIILLFALASTLFTIKSGIKEKATDFSAKLEAEKSLLSLLQSGPENLTLSDMLRISRINSTYEDKAKNSIESLNNVYKSWAFYSLNIVLGKFKKEMIESELPDFKGNIKVEFEVSDE